VGSLFTASGAGAGLISRGRGPEGAVQELPHGSYDVHVASACWVVALSPDCRLHWGRAGPGEAEEEGEDSEAVLESEHPALGGGLPRELPSLGLRVPVARMGRRPALMLRIRAFQRDCQRD
jgi:hypothetical protein